MEWSLCYKHKYSNPDIFETWLTFDISNLDNLVEQNLQFKIS